MIDFVLNFQFNTLLAVYLYWLPLAVCLVGYTVRTVKHYRKEVARREDYIRSNYHCFDTTLTLGVVVGRLFCAVVPGLNILAMIFSVGGPMLRDIFEFFSDLLNIPLVRPLKKN